MSEEAKPALIKDLAGLSTPLTKLVETLGMGFGRVSDGVSRIVNAYWLANKDAQNEAERIRLVEGAKSQMLAERAKMLGALSSNSQRELKSLDITGEGVSAQLAGVSPELIELRIRSERHAAYENLVQQLNWDTVTEFAAEVLAKEATVAQQPVDPDWVTRLRNIARDVSSEEMQALWGKLLAGEIKQPGTYSLRALEVLRNLTQREATIFQKVASLVVVTYSSAIKSTVHFVYKGAYLDEYVEYHDFMRLFDCGLMAPVTGNYSWTMAEVNDFGIRVGSKVLHIEGKPTLSSLLNVKAYYFTLAGAELINLVTIDTPVAYLKDLAKVFKERGLAISYADFIRYKENNVMSTGDLFSPL